MPVYRVEVQIAATAYLKAKNKKEATKWAEALKGTTIEVKTTAGDIETSELQFDDPELPDTSLSPAMTIVGPWAGDEPELAE